MNTITQQQKLTLDFNQKSYQTVIAKQYDDGSRIIHIQCTDNGKAFVLPHSCIAQIKIITPDQRTIINTVPVQENGSLLLELTKSMLLCPGTAKAEIRIYDNPGKLLPDMNYDTTESNLLSTMQFSILIEPSVFNDNRIIGGDEFNALTELIAKANTDYTYVLVTAKESADSAQASENNAKDSETHAAASAGNAANSASIATEKSAEAADSADSSAGSANDAAQMAASAKASASLAQSHAAEAASLTHGGTGTREGENSDNAQYYYLQSKSISESLAGALRPMGTVAFEGLPPLSSEKEGNMYNISEEFITTAAFKEGEGHAIPAGANVYKTSDGFWDILAGTPVTGVKGESESSYRRGNVSITREDIGLGNVEDKSSETIRSELTKENVVDALGYTPSAADGTVTGIKGNAETAYRTGNVNITPENIGFGKKELVDMIYPIGSIYMSVSPTNPATLFGGTWVAWGAGRVPVGINTGISEFNAIEKTGGELTHYLTTEELPSHYHQMAYNNTKSAGTSGFGLTQNPNFQDRVAVTASSSYYGGTLRTGGNMAHNNLQPYITCYMWKRTA